MEQIAPTLELANWLTVNPSMTAVQNLLQRIILTLDSHRKNDSSLHTHGIQSYDSTAPNEQEKKQRKKDEAEVEAAQWLKIPWRRNEVQQISVHTLINDPEIKEAHPLKGDNEVIKISDSLAVPNGVWLQNYGKVCQEADVDAPKAVKYPLLLPALVSADASQDTFCLLTQNVSCIESKDAFMPYCGASYLNLQSCCTACLFFYNSILSN